MKIEKWPFLAIFALRLFVGGHKIAKIKMIKHPFPTDFSKYPKDNLYQFLGDFKHFPGSLKIFRAKNKMLRK